MTRLKIVLALAVLAAPPALARTPNITAISPVTTGGAQTITLTGRSFGVLSPYSGDSDYISVIVCKKKDCHNSWQAGYAPNHNAVGLIIQSWTNNSIVIGGFTNYDGNHGTRPQWVIRDGNYVHFQIFKPTTGQTGKKSTCVAVAGAGQTTCRS